MNDRAFTIIEVTVSVLVLSVGLLGLLSTASVVSQVIAEARSHGRLGAKAVQEMERLHVHGCQFTPGREGAGAADVTRTVTEAGNGVRLVLLAVTSRRRRGVRVDTIATSLGC